MRIIAGRHKGRVLTTPSGSATRPTTDRIREALFNILAHGTPPLEDANVLDFFAGSGALGLEALSRGAAFCLFFETDPPARAAIRRNIETLNETGRTKIFKRDARRPGEKPGNVPRAFDLVFCDAPYGTAAHMPALCEAAAGGWLAPGARAVVETGREETVEVPGFEITDTRLYGETKMTFLTWPG